MTVELRPATPADRGFLCEVYSSTRADELAAVPWDDAQRTAFLRMQFDAQDRWYHEQMPGAGFDVVLLDGVPAGRLYVDRRAQEIRIVDIALLPEHRGAGIGTGLIRAVLAEGDASGTPVTIHVELGNPARALYERLGFAEIATTGVYALLERRPVAGATRRQVLQAGAAGGAALWLASGPATAMAAVGTPAAGADETYLRRSAWLPLAGTDIPVDRGPALRLEAITDVANAAERRLSGSDDAFVLLFSGNGSSPLEQGVHRFLPHGARAELFAAPVAMPGPRQLYEVLIDRSVRLSRVDPPRAPSGAAPAAVAAPAADVPGQEAVEPDRRYRFLKSVALRRGRPGLQARLRFAKNARLRSVTLRVSRDGVVHARGRGDVRGRNGLVGLRVLAPMPRGYYDVVVVGVDRKGVRTVVRRSVMIRS
jgi:GNAT superfamily N-acetyltransferase